MKLPKNKSTKIGLIFTVSIIALVVLVSFYGRVHYTGMQEGKAIQKCVDELGCECTPEIVYETYLPEELKEITLYPICLQAFTEGD